MLNSIDMKILWFIHAPDSNIAEFINLPQYETGYWIDSLREDLRLIPGIDLYVGFVSPNIESQLHFKKNGVEYYCFPLNRIIKRNRILRAIETAIFSRKFLKLFLNNCIEIIGAVNPDIIHIHGSELPYGFLSKTTNIPFVLSIQGILSKIVPVFTGSFTIPQLSLSPYLLYDYLLLKRHANLEKKIFACNKNFIGRTNWDKQNILDAVPSAAYYSCNEPLRRIFYDKSWSLENVSRYTIYTTTAILPYKGINDLINAFQILKNKYPEAQLRIGGTIPKTGLGKVIRDQVKKLNLIDSVHFLGKMDANMIYRELINSHVYVMPSYIENSSNSLCEAQLAGIPVVAANTGGIPSLVMDRVTGLLFQPGNIAQLITAVDEVITDDLFAKNISSQSRAMALQRHNHEKIITNLYDIYNSVIGLPHEESEGVN